MSRVIALASLTRRTGRAEGWRGRVRRVGGRAVPLAILPLIVIVGSGCGASTAPLAPRSTPSASACAAALTGATALTAVPGFPELTLSGSNVSNGPVTSGGGDGQFAVRDYKVCRTVSGAGDPAGAAALRGFYAAALAAGGWQVSATFPYDGLAQTACLDLCFARDAAPRYLSLADFGDAGGGAVLYALTVATPPRAPPCTPDPAGLYGSRAYVAGLDVTPAVPAPPLTKLGIGSAGTADGVTQGGGTGLCSAGTANSLTDFYKVELPKGGWTVSAPPAALTAACTAGGTPGWSGVQWWNAGTLFRWQADGSAGAGGIFWSYSFCAVGAS